MLSGPAKRHCAHVGTGNLLSGILLAFAITRVNMNFIQHYRKTMKVVDATLFRSRLTMKAAANQAT
jgi:hypothetical protein